MVSYMITMVAKNMLRTIEGNLFFNDFEYEAAVDVNECLKQME